MAQFMMDSGMNAPKKGRGCSSTLMGPCTRAILRRTYLMDMERRPNLMVPYMWVSSLKVCSKVRASSNGPMVLNTRVNGKPMR